MNIRDMIPWHRRSGSHIPRTLAGTNRDPLQSLHNEVDRMFEEIVRLSTPGQHWFGSGGDIWPQIELTDDEREVQVVADLPGMKQKDIQVSFEDGVLTLKGEKRSESDSKENQFSERFYGRFERQIPIGYELDEDKIDARFDNGVLIVTLPKSENPKLHARQIDIRS